MNEPNEEEAEKVENPVCFEASEKSVSDEVRDFP